MPQLFQVLKCFKCSAFQVHQTKKSNKWECKLCGEKQSMKRHYGLGTGKECRLHVQKLNGIRGELEDSYETAELNESSDEVTVENISNEQANTRSKWSDFVEETKDHQEPECDKSMYIGNTEVVLELPAKKRKFSKPKSKNQTAILNTHSNATDADIFPNISEPTSSYSVHPVPLNKTQENRFIKTTYQGAKCNIDDPKQLHSNESFVPQKIDKTSKWAQFADESDEENNVFSDYNSFSNDEAKAKMSGDDFNLQSSNNVINNEANNDEKLRVCKDENHENRLYTRNLFSLCDENDLDDVLNI